MLNRIKNNRKFISAVRTSLLLQLFLLLLLSPVFGNDKDKVSLKGSTAAAGIFSDSVHNLVLDSAGIENFFKVFPAKNNTKIPVQQFYLKRGYKFAWVTEMGLTSGAFSFYQQMKSDSRDFADESLNNVKLDSLFDDLFQNEQTFFTNKSRAEMLELLLTSSFFKYAVKMYGGITKESKDLEWYIPRNKKNYIALLDSLVAWNPGEHLEEPVNEYYSRLREQLKIFRAIGKNGGLPVVPTSKTLRSLGTRDSSLIIAKQYLSLTGDLTTNDYTILFDDSLANAVQHYQKRMGLAVTGNINPATVMEMNKSIDMRIRQIMINMERLRWAPVTMEKDYLLVNIPEFKLHVFENNEPVWVTNVVVGKAVRQTSIFRDEVSQIVLNPYWNIPPSITRNEILPHIRNNSNYLKNNNMEIVSGNPLVVRQKPGSGNALGRVKFLFPNNYNIYLHDTPSKYLFSETNRAFSHGCIRVQDPFWLAQYLLRKDSLWTAGKIAEIVTAGASFSIKIDPVVPVYIVYFTAWVDSKGQINFRNDVYDLDKKLALEIFEK
ncbi:MAG: L,D-transpeptidase family protein [Rhizobacter sp.]|nr:L,D-transpeptidase family protein [Ferruginibacter sp.]